MSDEPRINAAHTALAAIEAITKSERAEDAIPRIADWCRRGLEFLENGEPTALGILANYSQELGEEFAETEEEEL
jgi:hypothetical protein